MNENMPRISVIIPVYNSEKTLPDCATSALVQGDSSVEVILIDDGSTDGSRAMCDCLAASDARVRVTHQKNAGVSAARNVGLAQARGAWICFLDADDLLAPGAFDALLPAIDLSPDIVFFSWKAFLDDQAPFAGAAPQKSAPRALSGDELELIRLNTMYRADYLATTKLGFTFARGIWGCLMRADILRGHDLRFQEGVRMGEDAAFRMSYLAYCDRAVALDAALYGYRQSDASVTHRMNPRVADDIRRTIACFRVTLETHYPRDREMLRRFYAEAVFESQWLFLLYLSHPSCRLSGGEREKALDDMLEADDMRSAVQYCDRTLLLPPLDRLLEAYRLQNAKERYRAASAAMRKSRFRKTVTAFLHRLGVLERFKYWYRALRQKLRDARR